MATSVSGTYAVGPGSSATDNTGEVFAINGAGQITVNGRIDPTTANVEGLGFYYGLVWQKNADNAWYSKGSSADTWTQFPVPGFIPMPVPAASNNYSAFAFADGKGNQWTLNDAKQVVVDGVADDTTAGVIRLVLASGAIWQENVEGNWYSKITPSDRWRPATRTSPLPSGKGLTWTATTTDPTQADAWVAADGSHHAPFPAETLVMDGGTMNLGGGNLAGRLDFCPFRPPGRPSEPFRSKRKPASTRRHQNQRCRNKYISRPSGTPANRYRSVQDRPAPSPPNL